MERDPHPELLLGVVAHEMEGRPTGVGRYARELLLALRSTPQARNWRIRPFFRGRPFEDPLWADSTAGGCSFEPVFDRRPDAHPVLWEQFRLPGILRRRPVDLLFAPGYSLPRGYEQPSLVTIHDVSFEVRPTDFGFRERWRRRLLARTAARRATRVLTDTERTATELKQRYGLSPGQIAVTPLGVSPRFGAARQAVPGSRGGAANAAGTTSVERAAPGSDTRTPSADRGRAGSSSGEELAKLGVRSPYLLVLGSILTRRRLDLVLAGLDRLFGELPGAGAAAGGGDLALASLQLVLAGNNGLPQRGDLDRMIRSSATADRVVRLGYVADELLPELYAAAHGTIYLSEYEGYGLPPLESLAAGTPALVSDAPALLELWPDYPLRCGRLDLETVTHGLQRLLFDDEARRDAVDVGAARVRSLTWARAAERFAVEVEKAWRTAREPGG